jgi:hypothetical protein
MTLKSEELIKKPTVSKTTKPNLKISKKLKDKNAKVVIIDTPILDGVSTKKVKRTISKKNVLPPNNSKNNKSEKVEKVEKISAEKNVSKKKIKEPVKATTVSKETNVKPVAKPKRALHLNLNAEKKSITNENQPVNSVVVEKQAINSSEKQPVNSVVEKQVINSSEKQPVDSIEKIVIREQIIPVIEIENKAKKVYEKKEIKINQNSSFFFEPSVFQRFNIDISNIDDTEISTVVNNEEKETENKTTILDAETTVLDEEATALDTETKILDTEATALNEETTTLNTETTSVEEKSDLSTTENSEYDFISEDAVYDFVSKDEEYDFVSYAVNNFATINTTNDDVEEIINTTDIEDAEEIINTTDIEDAEEIINTTDIENNEEISNIEDTEIISELDDVENLKDLISVDDILLSDIDLEDFLNTPPIESEIIDNITNTENYEETNIETNEKLISEIDNGNDYLQEAAGNIEILGNIQEKTSVNKFFESSIPSIDENNNSYLKKSSFSSIFKKFSYDEAELLENSINNFENINSSLNINSSIPDINNALANSNVEEKNITELEVNASSNTLVIPTSSPATIETNSTDVENSSNDFYTNIITPEATPTLDLESLSDSELDKEIEKFLEEKEKTSKFENNNDEDFSIENYFGIYEDDELEENKDIELDENQDAEFEETQDIELDEDQNVDLDEDQDDELDENKDDELEENQDIELDEDISLDDISLDDISLEDFENLESSLDVNTLIENIDDEKTVEDILYEKFSDTNIIDNDSKNELLSEVLSDEENSTNIQENQKLNDSTSDFFKIIDSLTKTITELENTSYMPENTSNIVEKPQEFEQDILEEESLIPQKEIENEKAINILINEDDIFSISILNETYEIVADFDGISVLSENIHISTPKNNFFVEVGEKYIEIHNHKDYFLVNTNFEDIEFANAINNVTFAKKHNKIELNIKEAFKISSVNKKIELSMLNTSIANLTSSTNEEKSEDDSSICDNKTLLISEETQKVYLPYTIEEVMKKLNDSSEYQTIEDVIANEYTLPLSTFKNPIISRFKEAYKFMREKEKSSIYAALDLAVELMFNSNLNPAVIRAAKDLKELNIYLDCLYENEIDKFDCFKVVYKVLPKIQ